MDPGALILIVTVLVVLLLFSLLRGGGGVRRRPEVVQLLLFDVKMNQALVEAFYQREKPRRFEKTNWEISKGKISFLGEELVQTLRETFAIVEDLNRQMKEIKKSRSGSHRDLDVSVLNEPLARSREGLETWMMDNLGTLEAPIRYPSITGFLFGER